MRIKTHFIIMLLLLATTTIQAQNKSFKDLIVGAWVDGISFDTDSAGNTVERIGLNIGQGQPPSRQFDSIPTNLVFNSLGETFAYYNDQYEELQLVPFSYHIVGDTLKLGSRNYLFESIDEKELILRELNLLQLSGDFTYQKYHRKNFDNFQSDTKEYARAIKGDWQTEFILQVKFTKEKWNNRPGITVTDTLSKPITEPEVKFDFDDTFMRMFSDDKSIPSEEFRYNIIANYILDEDGNGLFTILEVSEKELTLLGPHALEMEGLPMMFWKLIRPKSQ